MLLLSLNSICTLKYAYGKQFAYEIELYYLVNNVRAEGEVIISIMAQRVDLPLLM